MKVKSVIHGWVMHLVFISLLNFVLSSAASWPIEAETS